MENYNTRFALLNFLQFRRVREGTGSFVYFKVHEKKNEYLVLDQADQPLATTSHDAFLLFITTYHTTLVEETPDGFQIWKLRLDSLKEPRDAGGLATSFIRR